MLCSEIDTTRYKIFFKKTSLKQLYNMLKSRLIKFNKKYYQLI